MDLNTTYTCTGGIQVANNYQKCWKPGGHGTENLTQGLMNSCNPFFVTIGQKLGKDTFINILKRSVLPKNRHRPACGGDSRSRRDISLSQ